jgi:hypothetical protein
MRVRIVVVILAASAVATKALLARDRRASSPADTGVDDA